MTARCCFSPVRYCYSPVRYCLSPSRSCLDPVLWNDKNSSVWMLITNPARYAMAMPVLSHTALYLPGAVLILLSPCFKIWVSIVALIPPNPAKIFPGTALVLPYSCYIMSFLPGLAKYCFRILTPVAAVEEPLVRILITSPVWLLQGCASVAPRTCEVLL